MMYKKKSGTARRIKALALVPMLGLALAATALPPVSTAIKAISRSEVSIDKGSDNNPDRQNKTEKKTDTKGDRQTITTTTTTSSDGSNYKVTFSHNGEERTLTLDKSMAEDGVYYFLDFKQVPKAEFSGVASDIVKSMSISKSDDITIILVSTK